MTELASQPPELRYVKAYSPLKRSSIPSLEP